MRKQFLFASLMCVLIRKAPPLRRGGGRRPEGFGPRGLLRHRRGKYFVLILLFAIIATSTLAANGILPGTGIETDPYLIEDLDDFDRFVADPNYWAVGVHTKLMTDIDLSGRTYTTAVIAPDTDNTNNTFEGTSFSGIFDGDDFTVSNLNINAEDTNNNFLGLFGEKRGSTSEIRNLGIKNVCIFGGIGSDFLGGLVSFNDGGSVINCHSSGSVSGSLLVGGLIGRNRNGTVANCYSTVKVCGSGRIGGLLGQSEIASNVINCYSAGDCGNFGVSTAVSSNRVS